jgi:hypothetical protein
MLFNFTGVFNMASNMFKFIGAMVVYGFATYGLTAWWKDSHAESDSPNSGHE